MVNTSITILWGLVVPVCPCDGIGIHTALRRQVLRVRIPPWVPCLGDGIGIRVGPRSQILRVRIPLKAPYKGIVQR